MNPKPWETLRKAADLLEERGWTRQVYRSPEGCLCTLGAIYTACPGTGWSSDNIIPYPDWEEANPALEVLMGYLELDYVSEIPQWNDYRAAGAGEVVEALREAATEAERGAV